MPRLSRTTLVAGAVAVALAATGGGVALATSGTTATDDDAPITGAALERASQAALAEVGEGRVTETETGDEESLYEVEVTLDDGSEVDVQLDEQFRVVSTEAEAEDDDELDDDDADDDEDDELDDRD